MRGKSCIKATAELCVKNCDIIDWIYCTARAGGFILLGARSNTSRRIIVIPTLLPRVCNIMLRGRVVLVVELANSRPRPQEQNNSISPLSGAGG